MATAGFARFRHRVNSNVGRLICDGGKIQAIVESRIDMVSLPI
jgi:hypothetical protein